MGFIIFMSVIVSVCVFACLIQGNGDKEEQSMEAPILLGNHNDCKIDKGRYVETDVSGYKAVIYVPSGIDNEQIQKALDYAYSTLCQSCYMEFILADNFLLISKEVFDKKKVFKFNLKKHFTDCQKSVRETMKLYERHMDEDYYNEYSTYLWDLIKDKVEKLRKMIENKLRNLKCKYNPYLSSYAITIQNLVQQINDTHKHVMEITEREYGVDIAPSYENYRAKMAFTQADNCLYDIMHDEAKKFRDNIVKDKKIIAVWSDITKTLYDPINAKKARISAFYSMPKETQALYNLREEDGFCEPKDGTKKFKKGA